MVSLSRPSSPESDDSYGDVTVERLAAWASNPSGSRLGLPSREPLAPPSPTITDSEALLDSVVRTAQASRLRRRGAIRIEGGIPRPVRVRDLAETDQDSDLDDPDTRQPGAAFVVRHNVRLEDASGDFALHCGGPISTTPAQSPPPGGPFHPSPLPTFRSSTNRKGKNKSVAKIASNGCGALVQTRAAASEQLSVWYANSEPTDMVVPLDSTYVDQGPRNVISTGKARCGCVQEGIGCRGCGNSLGMRIRLCSRHRSPNASLRPSSTSRQAATFPSLNVYNPFNVSHVSPNPCTFPFDIPAFTTSPAPIDQADEILHDIPYFDQPWNRRRPASPPFIAASPSPSSPTSTISSPPPLVQLAGFQCPTPSRMLTEDGEAGLYPRPAGALLWDVLHGFEAVRFAENLASDSDGRLDLASSNTNDENSVPSSPRMTSQRVLGSSATPDLGPTTSARQVSPQSYDVFQGQLGPTHARLDTLRERLDRLLTL